MPFTFCHPALVLPLNYLPWRWRSLTGLVAGAIVPDFEYFLRVSHFSKYSHTIPGIFWFDLPLGIVMAFLFHNLLRDGLILNMPLALQKRCSHYYQLNWNIILRKKWVVIIASVLLGAASHLLWDGFTHETADSLRTLPFKDDFRAVTKGKVNAYSLYTQVSSAIGGLIIIYSVWQLPKRRPVTTASSNKFYWPVTAFLAAVMFYILFRAGFGSGLEGYMIIFVDSLLLSLLIVSFTIYPPFKR